MRILFCNYEYPPIGGGGGVVNAGLAEELAKRHDVTVLTSCGLGLPELEEVNRVRVVRVPVFFRRRIAAANFPSMIAYLPMGISRGRDLIRREHFDIINTHFVLPTGPVGDRLSRFGQIPNVLSVHGGDLYDPSKWTSPHRHLFLRRWIRSLLCRADCVVGQSRNTLSNMRRFYAPDVEGVNIPLGITRPQLPKATKADFGFDTQDKLLITVGRLVSRKGVDQLIDVIKALGDSNVKLLIIGSGPQEEALRAQAQDSGVGKQVLFMGQVSENDKFALLTLSDLFVSTSQHEGFGLVFVEAMAARLPIVCYDFGGQTDFLEDQRTGGVISLNERTRFTEAVRSFLADPGWCAEIGESNQRLAESFFIDSCAAQYEELFEGLISAPRDATSRN